MNARGAPGTRGELANANSTTANTNGTLNTNTTVLKALRREFGELKTQHQDELSAIRSELNKVTAGLDTYKDSIDSKLQAMEEKGHKRDQALFESIKKQNTYIQKLEQTLMILTAERVADVKAGPGDLPDFSTAEGDDSMIDPLLVAEDREAIQAECTRVDQSRVIAKKSLHVKVSNRHAVVLHSPAYQNAIVEVFKHLMIVGSLMPRNLPDYPFGIDVSNDAWPKDATTGTPALRFRWNRGKDHPDNMANLETIRDYTIANGAGLYPDAIKDLKLVMKQHLMERVVAKFEYMRNGFNKLKNKDNGKNKLSVLDRDDPDFLEDDAEEDVEEVRSKSNLTRAEKNSRAQSRLEELNRKRPTSAYTDNKFDAAFTLTALSDDEDHPDNMPGQPRKFLSRPPGWRSAQLVELYQDIRTQPDPDPEKGKALIARERGPELNQPPPKTKDLKYRVRTWMVKPELLVENPQWVTTNRVASSGASWDEPEPNVAVKMRGKRKATGLAPDEEEKVRKEARLRLEGGENMGDIVVEELECIFGPLTSATPTSNATGLNGESGVVTDVPMVM